MSDTSHRLASKAVFADIEPQETGADRLSRSWITRGGNFAVVYSRVESGAVLARANNAEEYMVILPPDGTAARIQAGGDSVAAAPDSLTIVPPGASAITATTAGVVARIFSRASADVMSKAWNAATYADGALELEPPDLWPLPVGGYRLRHYPLGPHFDPQGDRIQPRCFRSTNMMVNLFGHYFTRRDTSKLSPHWHDDFEQASLTLNGRWIHHLRYNWGADLNAWVPDDHSEMATPSVIIIPARAIHTSRDVGPDGPESSLYDIFCPPRMDFAAKPGFVLNEAEYPLPDRAPGAAPPKAKTGGTLLAWQKPG